MKSEGRYLSSEKESQIIYQIPIVNSSFLFIRIVSYTNFIN